MRVAFLQNKIVLRFIFDDFNNEWNGKYAMYEKTLLHLHAA